MANLLSLCQPCSKLSNIKAANVGEVRARYGTLRAVGVFFKSSPKRQRCLEKAILDVNKKRKTVQLPTIRAKKTKEPV